jgi:hypothetical protein
MFSKIYDYGNEEKAKNHDVGYMKGLKHANYYIPCKYYITSQYAEAFFTCIGEANQYIYSYGVTDEDVSKLLDN